MKTIVLTAIAVGGLIYSAIGTDSLDRGAEKAAFKARLDRAGVRYDLVDIETNGVLRFYDSDGGLVDWGVFFPVAPSDKQLAGIARFQKAGGKCKLLMVETNGMWHLTTSGTGLSDLSCLQGLPIESLDLTYTWVTNLAPLARLPLKLLWIRGTRVSDLSPLRETPLVDLNICDTPVKDLSPLTGMKLTSLDISRSKVTVLTPLKGMPLEQLDISGTMARDVSMLKGMKLKYFFFTSANITNGLDAIRSMKSLQGIGPASWEYSSPTEFWRKYDAGQFNTEKSKDKQ